VMDGAVVGEGAQLRNCVVGNRAVVEPGAVMSGVILADSASVGVSA